MKNTTGKSNDPHRIRPAWKTEPAVHPGVGGPGSGQYLNTALIFPHFAGPLWRASGNFFKNSLLKQQK
ncbi:MAG TPA: hypothetical protein VJ998_12795 [Pseudomonadales bacterium]|nr:hypothetical protein [Pseudomonadales bacterium]